MVLGHLDPRHVIADFSALTKYKRLNVGVVSEIFQKYDFSPHRRFTLTVRFRFFQLSFSVFKRD